MSDSIEWIDTRHERPTFSVTPGEFTDPFGSSNDGPALAFGNVVVEAPTSEAMAAWLEEALVAVRRTLPGLRCQHCGGEVEVKADGFHYVHVSNNSKYCRPDGGDNAVRSAADVVPNG